MQTKNTKKVVPLKGAAISPEKTDNKAIAAALKEVIANAGDRPEAQNLSPEALAAAVELLTLRADAMAKCSDPILLPNGNIEYVLMTGAKMVVKPAFAYHTMLAEKEMSARDEKGDRNALRSTYTLVACSTIDGEPMIVEDLQDKVTAFDFNVIFNYFTTLNLL